MIRRQGQWESRNRKALNVAVNKGADPEVVRILAARILSRRHSNTRQRNRSLSPRARRALQEYPGEISLEINQYGYVQ